MSLSGFIKLVGKAIRFSINRPLQRFNVYNRAKKYLGPDAKKFMPAPRAIGALSQNNWKPSQYPHLESGYKSIKQRRLDAVNRQKQLELPSESESGNSNTPKSYSENKSDDDLIIEASNKLEVTKTVIKIDPPDKQVQQISESDNNADTENSVKIPRALPKSTNLQLSDLASIWAVDKVPKGRLDLNKLQEIMINKLGDDAYWTPKMIAEKHNIKESYAENLLKYMKQIRIVVSPRMSKALDYVGRNDPGYQAAKHLIYFVDKRLRTNIDKKYDSMYLPGEQLDEEVRELVDTPADIARATESNVERQKRVARPAPLRIAPINQPVFKEPERRVRQLPERIESSKENESVR